MSGTTIGKGTNVISMLDRLMQVETGPIGVGPGAEPPNGTFILQDGRQLPIEQGKSRDLGAILALISTCTSHEVNERIIRNMGVHAGKPVSHETMERLREVTVEAIEQRNLEVVARFDMLGELERIDPGFARELRSYGPEIGVFEEVFTAILQEEARRCARRGEEMKDEQARAAIERALRDQKFRKAPLANPQHLARAVQRAVQLWGQQKGHTPMRERLQTIETDVRSGGPGLRVVSEMVQQYEGPYTTEEIARRMLDKLEEEVAKKR